MALRGIELTLSFQIQSCINCGVAFAIPSELNDRLRETHRAFYCPNGHKQWYTGETEADRLRKQLDAETQRSRQLSLEKAQIEAQASKLAKRIAAGVCPCCNRTFQNLARHIETKHQGQVAELPAPAHKRLAAG